MVTFPPGKSGGLIEAQRLRPGGYAGHGGFRRVNSAASLKRAGRGHCPCFWDRFRRVNPAASLKLNKRRRERMLLPWVSAG